MATVEEKLIGFQLVRNTNRMTRNTLQMTSTLKGYNSSFKTVEGIRETVQLAHAFVANVSYKQEQFLLRYPDQDEVSRALSLHKTVRKQIEDDGLNLKAVNLSIKQAAEAAKSLQELSLAGDQALSQIEENTTEIVSYIDHYQPIHMLTAAWDLVCASAIALQGRTAGSNKTFASFEAQKDRVEKYLTTFFRQIVFVKEDNAFTRTLVEAMRLLERELPRVTSTGQAATLGEQVDGMVPRIPLVRRWWQYGN